MRNILRTVVRELGIAVAMLLAFSVLYILASLIFKGHVDWY
jgi:hypothetical protein